jgi:hypothetical protein
MMREMVCYGIIDGKLVGFVCLEVCDVVHRFEADVRLVRTTVVQRFSSRFRS